MIRSLDTKDIEELFTQKYSRKSRPDLIEDYKTVLINDGAFEFNFKVTKKEYISELHKLYLLAVEKKDINRAYIILDRLTDECRKLATGETDEKTTDKDDKDMAKLLQAFRIDEKQGLNI